MNLLDIAAFTYSIASFGFIIIFGQTQIMLQAISPLYPLTQQFVFSPFYNKSTYTIFLLGSTVFVTIWLFNIAMENPQNKWRFSSLGK